MIRWLWAGMILIGILAGALQGDWGSITAGAMAGAADGVQLCIILLGAYGLWMGLMSIARRSGILEKLSGMLSYLLRPLFGLSHNHPAWTPIAVNLTANLLGMGNAATPAGIEAMHALYQQSPSPRASNAMVMFLCINASSIQLLPTTVISLRMAANSAAPDAIIIPTLIVSLCSTLAAIFLCKMLERVWP